MENSYFCTRKEIKTTCNMTALELRTTINADLDIMSVDMLENISRYVGRLASHVRNRKNATSAIAPRKVRISSRIRQMSGRFSVPADVDVKALKADMLTDKYME